ncbi:MAG: hypothetical protein IIY70_03070 [Oscillospiraceae bacterium]|nr:hypothetical protein [Oscillospiraceae bacterium]
MKRMMSWFLSLGLALSAYTPNPGVRHETAGQLSDAARAYYTGESGIEVLSALEGSTSD